MLDAKPFLSIQAQDFIEDSGSMSRAFTAGRGFLSIQAQDFIEERIRRASMRHGLFLSIQAQDFIEETPTKWTTPSKPSFLSIQAQDFIEDSDGILGKPERRGRFLSIQAQDFIEDNCGC